MLTRLREARKARGLTHDDVARLLGVQRTTYTSWELGRRRIPGDIMLRLAIAFGERAEDLFGDLLSRQSRTREERSP